MAAYALFRRKGFFETLLEGFRETPPDNNFSLCTDARLGARPVPAGLKPT
jgi:hypothetical protein